MYMIYQGFSFHAQYHDIYRSLAEDNIFAKGSFFATEV